jgi:hypothetical protein
MSQQKIKVTCDKCNGTGYLSYHSNYANGVCFPCQGTGKITVRKNSRKPSFDWDYHAKKITFIINLTEEKMDKMTEKQVLEMDHYVYAMTMDRQCMWLYHFYVEAFRAKAIRIINNSLINQYEYA